MGNEAARGAIPRAGEILAGRYEIGEPLGSGGMGVVVAAKHVELRKEVAIKLLYPELIGEAEAVARFLREARLMASLQGEHVTRVYDVGRLPSGAPYMVMERLHGTDLHKVARRGALPIEVAIDIILQASEAVAEAHAQGIVHRDLKPANLFVTTRVDGSTLIKVLDFGISKLTDAGRTGDLEGTFGGALTAPAMLMGTPHFISPEQIVAAHTVDHRTDVWALGAVLHRLIAGSVPFDAADSIACLRKVILDPPTPLRERCPAAPAALEAVILRCLEKDLEQRMPSVAALARALAPFAPARSQLSVERIVKMLGGPSEPEEERRAAPPAPEPPAPEPPAPEPLAPLRLPNPSAPPTHAPTRGATSTGLRWRAAPAPIPAPRPPVQGPPTAGLRLRPRKPDPT
jgi:serine/threonine-protein kinase